MSLRVMHGSSIDSPGAADHAVDAGTAPKQHTPSVSIRVHITCRRCGEHPGRSDDEASLWREVLEVTEGSGTLVRENWGYTHWTEHASDGCANWIVLLMPATVRPESAITRAVSEVRAGLTIHTLLTIVTYADWIVHSPGVGSVLSSPPEKFTGYQPCVTNILSTAKLSTHIPTRA